MCVNDDDLFQAEFADVKPLQQDKKLLKKAKDDINHAKNRQNAQSLEAKVHDPMQEGVVKQLNPFDIVGFKKDGVQEGVYRKLRLGKYDIDARLDLHRFSLDDARREVKRFIKDCLQYELRAVMILHGKGDRHQDPAKKALLKSHVTHWLGNMPEVLAYHSAQPHQGGAGAIYILLKKAEQAKQRNREKHGLR